MKIKLECAHADTCLSDYWSGHHLPHVQIHVHPGMTMRAIKDAIKSELMQGAIAGNDDNARLLSAEWVPPADEQKAIAITKAAYAAVNRMKPARKGQRRFFQDVEISEDDCTESVYAFFVFIEL